MRRLSLSIITIFSVLFSLAQTPQALNYQAVARNANGQLIIAQSVGVRFTILDGSATGTNIYQETHTVTTNNFGLFTLGIGTGTVGTGTFNTIPWQTGNKYLKVEIAPQGGTNYLLQGTTQLLSVPYALYAERTRLVAGTGINIAGNVISATTGANLWVTDANGIHNQSGNVGIGGNSSPSTALVITQQPTGGFSGGLEINSTDVWHTVMTTVNTSNGPNSRYSFDHGGSLSTEIGPGNFGIMNNNIAKYAIKINGSNNNVGIGLNNLANSETPRSKLHVYGGDVNIDQINSGIIMKSPNGQCWRITINNAGALVPTAITCP